MIKLTRSNDRDVWVEPSAIVMVESDATGVTIITLSTGRMLDVKDSVEYILSFGPSSTGSSGFVK
jgi:uncharacterized protein YlzI (FlbEa/FlbD family)